MLVASCSEQCSKPENVLSFSVESGAPLGFKCLNGIEEVVGFIGIGLQDLDLVDGDWSMGFLRITRELKKGFGNCLKTVTETSLLLALGNDTRQPKRVA